MIEEMEDCCMALGNKADKTTCKVITYGQNRSIVDNVKSN